MVLEYFGTGLTALKVLAKGKKSGLSPHTISFARDINTAIDLFFRQLYPMNSTLWYIKKTSANLITGHKHNSLC